MSSGVGAMDVQQNNGWSAGRALTAIVIVAFGLRLGHFFAIQSEDFLRRPVVTPDSAYNHTWALQGTGQTWPAGATAYYVPPLYMEGLRAFFFIAGDAPNAAKVFQILMGSLTPILVYWIGRQFFGNREGVFAAALCAVYPLLIFYESTLTKESVLVFLVAAALAVTISAIKATRQRTVWWLGCGIAWGCLSLVRPNVLPFMPCLAVIVLIQKGQPSLGKRFVYGLALTLGCVMTIAPVTIRNYIVADDFVLVNGNGGFSFYAGNRVGGDAYYTGVPGISDSIMGEAADTKRIAEKALLRPLKMSEVSSYYMGLGWEEIRRSPVDLCRRVWQKLIFALNSLEVPNAEHYYFVRQYSSVLRMPLPGFGVLLPWAMLGAFLSRRRGAEVWAFNLFALMSLASLLFFYVSDRYRLPLVPFVLVYGAAGLVWAWDSMQSRLGRRMVVVGVTAAGYVVTMWPVAEELRADLTLPRYGAARFVLMQGDPRRALGMFEQMRKERGGDRVEVIEGLAKCHIAMREFERAERFLAESIAREPNRIEAYFLRGRIQMVRQSLVQAAEDFRRVLELQPESVEANHYMGVIRHSQRQLDESRRHLEKAIASGSATSASYGEMGLVLSELRERGRAKEIVEEGLRRFPNDEGLRQVMGRLK
ncbi:MAG: glycosyltransferase family 39 protein [Planctomycetota bacterium]